MRIRIASLTSAGFVVASFVMAAALYTRLPESVPTHWNARGQANGFTPKPWGPFVMPLVMAGMYLLFWAIPRISPRGYRVERFERTFDILRTTLLGFFFLMNALVLLAGTGAPLPIDRLVPAGVGLLFIVLGNFMGKLTKNFFMGIRTPWTLASDEVWLRTHRLGGKLFVVAGLVALVSGALGGGPLPLLACALAAGLIPVVYSYVIYRRIEGFKP